MIEIGCLARYLYPFSEEVVFAKKNGFDLMQVWYDRDGINLPKDDLPKEKIIKQLGFPTIIHALLAIEDFEEHVPR
jgi:hypothetical protein